MMYTARATRGDAFEMNARETKGKARPSAVAHDHGDRRVFERAVKIVRVTANQDIRASWKVRRR